MLEKLHLRTKRAVPPASKTTWPRRIVLGLVVLIVGARLAAPSLVERFVNQKLSSLEGYTGHIDDVDLNLWRGAYQIEGIVIEKTGGKVPVPFVKMERLDLAVEWGALLDGEVVARIAAVRPELNFVKGPSKATSQDGTEADWRKTVEDLVPLRINKFTVVDGEVHYRDFHAAPKVDVMLDHVDATVSNLTNSKDFSGSRVAEIGARGTLMRSGKLEVNGKIDPFSKEPTFDITSSIEGLRLTQLNPFLKAYVNIDVEKGRLSVYSDLHAKEGRFNGYIKPLVEGLDVLRWKEEDERPLEKLWQGLVGGVAEIFENQKRDRLATRIPLSGRFDQPDINGWAAAFSLLRNAFIQALRHGLEMHES